MNQASFKSVQTAEVDSSDFGKGPKKAPLYQVLPYAGESIASIVRALEPAADYAVWQSAWSERNQGRDESSALTYICVEPEEVKHSECFDFSKGVQLDELFTGGRVGVEIPSALEGIPFLGGAFGFFAYSAGAEHPECFQLRVSKLLVVDEGRGLIYQIVWNGELDSSLSKKLDAISDEKQEIAQGESPAFHQQFQKQEFEKLVERGKEYLAAGDIYQVVLSNKFEVEGEVDPLCLYQGLLEASPSPYHFLFKTKDFSLVGASPEMFLQGDLKESRRIKMRPVAGTYPRSETSDSEGMAEKLLSDAKENAEHVMLVDHVRNDIGKVSDPGSVVVDKFLSVEQYSSVSHIVSEVSGELREDLGLVDAIESCFPIATLTGTPKVRAMEIIAELEQKPRGCFGGSVFMFGLNGFFDSAVIIRSAVLLADRAIIQGGAGVVIDSVPEKEYYECICKIKPLLDLLNVRAEFS